MTNHPLLRMLRRAPLGLALVLRCSLALAGQAPGAGAAPDAPARSATRPAPPRRAAS